MQVRRRFLTLSILSFAVILAVIWAENSADHLAIYVLAVLFAIMSIIIALTGYFDSEEEETHHIPAQRARQQALERFSSALSVPFMILADSGRIVFISDAMKQSFPWIKIGDHYSNLARASGFVDALRAALNGQKVEPFIFETNRQVQRVHFAVVSPLPKAKYGDEQGKLLIEIFDRTDAQRSDLMRRDFIANASHELRTPLAGILGGLETISQTPDKKTVDHFVPIMTKEAERMQRLIDDLMSLSRVEINEHYPPQEVVNLRAILTNSLNAMSAQIESENITIDNQFTADEEVLGDEDQLQQVFINVLDNAMKYGGKGTKVTITRMSHSPSYPRKVGISFADDGAGIEARHLSRLTERFYRVSKSQSLKKGGTGLGLAIVKHMVIRHQGELQITSKLGEGTSVTIWLPEIKK